jgi:DNA-binding SARP family transcriptional activator
MADALCVDLLGPLTVRYGGSVLNAGPIRQQAMLAVLALRTNQVTSPEQLLDLVWDESPPASGLRVFRALAAVRDGVHPMLAAGLQDQLAAASSGRSA